MKRIVTLLLAVIWSGMFFSLNAGGLYQFTHLTKENSNLSHNGTGTILQDTAGNIWVGTYAGLSKFDGRKFVNYDRVDFGVESDYISCLAEDSEEHIVAHAHRLEDARRKIQH